MRTVQLASLTVIVLLAACGGSPTRAPDSPSVSGESLSVPVARPTRPPAVVQKRGGGYYKDDGPGDEIPENLDDIPDAQPRAEPLHRFANRPYVVLGKSYTPETRVKPFRQRGIASWYGKKFHGQKTSIGEPYDMFSMTAAHPTLAIPSYVRVTNANTGKSVVVRVTDRGPFHADRIIDLSYAAAHRLGYVTNGSTLVEVEAVVPGDTTTYSQVKPPPVEAAEPDEIENLAISLAASGTPISSVSALPAAYTQPPPLAAEKGLFIQLGAFSSVENAESLRSHLSRELDWLNEEIQINVNAGMHRVHLGPYASRVDADKVAEKIRLALGYKPTFVVR